MSSPFQTHVLCKTPHCFYLTQETMKRVQTRWEWSIWSIHSSFIHSLYKLGHLLCTKDCAWLWPQSHKYHKHGLFLLGFTGKDAAGLSLAVCKPDLASRCAFLACPLFFKEYIILLPTSKSWKYYIKDKREVWFLRKDYMIWQDRPIGFYFMS